MWLLALAFEVCSFRKISVIWVNMKFNDVMIQWSLLLTRYSLPRCINQDFFVLCRCLVRFFPAICRLKCIVVKKCGLKALYRESHKLLIRDATSFRINKGNVSLICGVRSCSLNFVIHCRLSLWFLLAALLILGISLRPFFKIDSLGDTPELLGVRIELVDLLLFQNIVAQCPSKFIIASIFMYRDIFIFYALSGEK